jgi:two-component system nitrate/nitrite response regulator NarL
MTREATRDIRVLLAVAHRIVLSGLQRLIDDEKPHLRVIATADCGEAAVRLASTAKPDVAVVDVNLLEDSGDEIVRTLVKGNCERVLILGEGKSRKLHEAAILSGACGVVDKSEPPERLIKAIKKVHEGELWLDRSTTGRIFVELSKKSAQARDPKEQKIAALTLREWEVVRVLAKDPGADNKTLATNLHMGEHTLRNHLSRIYDKLGVPNRVELYLFAQRQETVTPH